MSTCQCSVGALLHLTLLLLSCKQLPIAPTIRQQCPLVSCLLLALSSLSVFSSFLTHLPAPPASYNSTHATLPCCQSRSCAHCRVPPHCLFLLCQQQKRRCSCVRTHAPNAVGSLLLRLRLRLLLLLLLLLLLAQSRTHKLRNHPQNSDEETHGST